MGERDGGGTRYLRQITQYPFALPLSRCYGPDGIGWANQDAGNGYGDVINVDVEDHRQEAGMHGATIAVNATVHLNTNGDSGEPEPVL